MIILVLVLIVLGGVTASVCAFAQGATWAIVLVAYIGGGWVGLLLGASVLLLIRCVAGWKGHVASLDLHKSTHLL
jgi:hypothetical protein